MSQDYDPNARKRLRPARFMSYEEALPSTAPTVLLALHQAEFAHLAAQVALGLVDLCEGHGERGRIEAPSGPIG